MLTHILSSLKKIFSPNYSSDALIFYITGLVDKSLNNRQQAIDCFEEALIVRESFQTGDHPYTARVYYQLALLHVKTNDYSIGLDCTQRSLTIQKNKLLHSCIKLKQTTKLFERLSQ